jgi:hypothetical protein
MFHLLASLLPASFADLGKKSKFHFTNHDIGTMLQNSLWDMVSLSEQAVMTQRQLSVKFKKSAGFQQNLQSSVSTCLAPLALWERGWGEGKPQTIESVLISLSNATKERQRVRLDKKRRRCPPPQSEVC